MSNHKRNDLSITIYLPEDHHVEKGTVTENGEIHLYDAAGNKVFPEKFERTMLYQGENKTRNRTLFTSEKISATVGGLEELAQYESLFCNRH